MRRLAALLLLALPIAPALADGPGDNRPDRVRRVPPPGIDLPDDDRKELEIGLERLRRALARLDRRPADLRADVEVYYKAVRDAVTHGEFFAPAGKDADPLADVAKARELLREGLDRAEALQVGQAPWTTKVGPVVRGYYSKIDGSAQPYGVVVPPSYSPAGAAKYRLDLWFHGRGETLSEVNFLDDRRRNPGQFTPPDTLVVHPYGRYCNANKFAGEVDTLEVLEAMARQYRVDEDRVGVRGFSMGGAACWQFAVHYADRWYAAAPGAGFAETPRFLDVFQKEKVEPTWFEKKLWRQYDCDLYAANLFHLPVVAYSGELDPQKQAADVMAEALGRSGVELTHIIGPGTKHAYHPDAKREVERRMDLLAARGREKDPARVYLTTYTLKYNRMHWLTIDALERHWERAWAGAAVVAHAYGAPLIDIGAENVAGLTLDFPPGSPLAALRGVPGQPIAAGRPKIDLDGQTFDVPGLNTDRSWRVSFTREGGRWRVGKADDAGLRKRHDLQGPIDDAFTDAFVFVRPTGPSPHPEVAAWADAELDRAVERWRRQFRGDARVVDDAKLTDEQVAAMNLVLWGDPASNAVLGRVADKLPIRWGADAIRVGDRSYPADTHVPLLIYPNPLNPSRYVVLNSGFTYREYDDLNNARQVPKLPDWAVVDVRTPPDARRPGAIVAADFFGESWELRPARD